MNKFIQIICIKICQSLFEYVGNLLYKSDNALKAGVLEDTLARLPALVFVSGLSPPLSICPPNSGFERIITYVACAFSSFWKWGNQNYKIGGFDVIKYFLKYSNGSKSS